ncbi:M56 family metallopeptidase [Actinoplanes sp. RD1]|uniref:M56 family metallopeptidase n=1 Tax=Actinoplanes sp. RD1 TaxID=3064538 RepID=UPI0027407D67|nr:M56 family metallopeptidase [Actinoplanes sp. RD1]
MKVPGEDVPSGTTQRLVTLIVLAVSSTVYLHGSMVALWPVDGTLPGPGCEVRTGAYVSPTNTDAERHAYNECMAGTMAWQLGWLLAGLLALALVTAAFYYTRPGRQIRRAGLRPLAEFPEIRDSLRAPLGALVARAGVRQPEFLLDATSMRAGGLAFGRGRRPLICLDAGLVALAGRDRPAFEAIVLHELAHVRHRDVTTTFTTLAVWRAFLLVAVVPYLIVAADPLLLSHDPWRLPPSFPLANEFGAGVAGRLSLLIALIYVARTAVLRSRELYADAAAAAWTGSNDPYRSLTAQPRRRVLRWIATHPSRGARDAVLRDATLLLRPGFAEVFAGGLALQLAWQHLSAALGQLNVVRYGNHSYDIMTWLWAAGIAAWIWVIARRGAAYREAGGTGRVFARAGLALGCGLCLGYVAALQTNGVAVDGFVTMPGLVVMALLVGTSVVLCGWAGYCARQLGARSGGCSGLLVAAALTVLAAASAGQLHGQRFTADNTWTAFLNPALRQAGTYAAGIPGLAADAPVTGTTVMVFIFAGQKITVVGVIVFWLVPLLLTHGWTGRIRYGTIAAAVAFGGWAVVVGLLRVTAGHPAGGQGALVSSAWELTVAAAGQLVIALAVARRRDWVSAAWATWLLAVLCCAATIELHRRAGWQVDSILAARPLQVLPATGAVAVLIALGVRTRRPAGVTGPGRWWASVPVATALAGGLAMTVWSPAAGHAVPVLAPPPLPTAAQLAVERDHRLITWLMGGGLMTLGDMNQASYAYLIGDRDGHTEAAQAAVCRRQRAAADRAAGFPPPPDDRLGVEYRAAIRELRDFTSSCPDNLPALYRSADHLAEVYRGTVSRALPD